MPPRKLPLRIVTAAFFFATLNGCVNQEDAAGLSKLSDQARSVLPRVSNDIAGTCARQNTLFDNTPSAELPPTAKALDCKPYQELAAQIARDQNILLDYFDAIGKLASNEPLAYEATIRTNTGTIGASSALSANAATAATDAQSLLKAIANAATRGYREKQLDQLLKETDAAVQSLTQSLKKVITGDYALMLSNEESTLDNFYQGPMAAARLPNDRLTLMLVQRHYAHDKTAIQARKDAVVSYGKLMDDLGALHAKLAQEAGQKASIKEIIKQISPIVESARTTLTDLQSR